jgi:hypothetical protein
VVARSTASVATKRPRGILTAHPPLSYDQDTQGKRFASRLQQGQARTALTTTIKMYRVMDMAVCLLQTEAVRA